MTQRSRETDLDWIELGRNNPYFGVLSNDKYRIENINSDVLDDFFQTGELDVKHYRDSIERYFGAIELKTGLDFGCGVGRLVRAMARYLDTVVGVDVSPGMLERARNHALPNTSFVDRIPEGGFDWINSTIVFQHIPPARGYELFHNLLDSVNVGGVFSIHTTFFKDDSYISALINTIKGGSWDGGKLLNVLTSNDRVGAILMYDYDYTKLLISAVSLRFHEIHLQHTNHGGCHGFVMYGRRS